jgi:hypothetical protein
VVVLHFSESQQLPLPLLVSHRLVPFLGPLGLVHGVTPKAL